MLLTSYINFHNNILHSNVFIPILIVYVCLHYVLMYINSVYFGANSACFDVNNVCFDVYFFMYIDTDQYSII